MEKYIISKLQLMKTYLLDLLKRLSGNIFRATRRFNELVLFLENETRLVSSVSALPQRAFQNISERICSFGN